jgi:hypothetical protein
MSRGAGTCIQCLALFVALIAAGFTGVSYAANGPAADISAEVWLGLFVTIVGALLAGYVRGQDRRISAQDKRILSGEHDFRQQQSQISLLRETVLREHPSRTETDQHRAYVESQLNHIRERLDHLTRTQH